MLSVGSRDDGRKGLGLGFGGGGGRRGGMEENELEEGEACSGQEDDPCIDPFIALSYIGEKLQDVLGHFQKDFEDGVSAENLGAKFGGYGSFLPSYQRSPSTRPQPRSPPRASNQNTSSSPYNPTFEGANPLVLTSVSASKNSHGSASQLLENSGKICISKLDAEEFVPQHDSFDKAANCSDHKTLKVRIKVGPENVLARNNAAIYSGLGLDISPSSSPEDSPYGSGGLSPEVRDAPDESPMTILQVMTCFSVPGGYLLSPLPDILLHLTKKESTSLKNCQTGSIRKGIPETSTIVADLTLPVRDANGFMEKIMKSDEKHGISMEVKNWNSKDHGSTILKRGIDNETPEDQKLTLPVLDVNGFVEEKMKSDEKHGISMEVHNSNSKDRTSTILKREIDNETPQGQKLTLTVRDVNDIMEKKMKSDEKHGISMELKNPNSQDHISTILKREIGNETPEGQKLTLLVRDVNGSMKKKMKSDEKHGISMEVKNSNSKDHISTFLKREIDNETPEGQKLVSDALNIPLLSGSRDADGRTDEQIMVDTMKATSMMLDLSKKSNTISGKDRISSPELAQHNQLEFTESTKNCRIGNSGNETIHSRGKLNSKTNLEEKAIEERNTSTHKGTSSDKQQIEQMGKVEKNYDTAKSDSIGYKGNRNAIAGISQQMSAKKGTLSEQDGETTILEKTQLSKSKRKGKESHINSASAVELTKENPRAVSSVGPKEKKKNSHARGDHSENKSKASKSSKEMSKDHIKESQRNAVSDVNAEQVGNRTDLLETHYTNKSRDVKLGQSKGSFTFTEKSNIRPVSKMVDNLAISEAFVEAPVNTPLNRNGPNSDAAVASHVPVVIKENWVACDICQEWRLLPPWTDPDDLPKKWQCSMQTWLPELNKCHIGEAVTTKALYALCQIPAPENDANLNGHHEVTASTITSADVLHVDQRCEHDMRRVQTAGKKKHGLKDESSIQTSTKIDVNEYPSETHSLNKFNLGRASKSRDYTTQKLNHKQKEKHKIQKPYSDGGDFIEKNGKHSKSKSKREVVEDGFRSAKKIKKEGFHYPVGDSQSNLDVTGREALSIDNVFSTRATGKHLQSNGGYTATEDMRCDPKGQLPAYINRSKNQVHDFTNGKFQEHSSASDLEKSYKDLSGKKRNIEEWQVNQRHQERQMSSQNMLDKRDIAKEALGQSELRKEKKAKVLKSEGKESSTGNADGRMDKGSSTRILLSGSRDHPLDGMREGRGVAGKEQQEQNHGRAVSRQGLDCTDYLKRDMDYAQPPAAATSSSSKVSGSRKSKANFQEAKGSPVESVSSSPLRSSSTEKLSTRRSSAGKDNVRNVGFSIMGSLQRYSHGDVDGESDQSGTRKKETSVQQRSLESQRAEESGVLDCLRGTCDRPDKEANQLSAGKPEDGMHLKSSTRDDLSLPEFENIDVVSGTRIILSQHNKDDCRGSNEEHILDHDEMNTDHRPNGPSQRESIKSSLRFKERDKSFIPDTDEGKLKVSSVFREQKESYTAKNGSSRRYETDIDSHDCSTYHVDLRDANDSAKEKKDDKYLGKKDSSIKWSVVGSRDVHSEYGIQENLDAHGLSSLSKQDKDFDSRVAGPSCSKSNLHENLQQARSQQYEKSSNQFFSDRVGQSELDTGRGKSRSFPPKDKHAVQSSSSQAAPTLLKRNKSEFHPSVAVNGDAPMVVKESRNPDSQSSLRQVTPICPDSSSPIKKDVHPAATAMLKEAIDLKHTSNRLKKEGLALESTGLCFEAALKFLHVASLREPPRFESAKHGDATQSVQMYSETAILCEFCANEYEIYKEMAAAALAYKCVEVAYMKVAYYKHPSAAKDRRELQAVLQIVPPGESPSSSASDVDNLNNQGTLDKAASAKGTTSPQIAGKHVITARNRHSFMRLVDYNHYVTSAFEATRKSQNAIAAASVNLGNGRVDAMSSVQKVLDFSFHNVEGLLRLVRLSMESISPS